MKQQELKSNAKLRIQELENSVQLKDKELEAMELKYRQERLSKEDDMTNEFTRDLIPRFFSDPEGVIDQINGVTKAMNRMDKIPSFQGYNKKKK